MQWLVIMFPKKRVHTLKTYIYRDRVPKLKLGTRWIKQRDDLPSFKIELEATRFQR